ncbi:DUF2909 domain-containing protein [SAR86 cluster bacterium]|jgi:hypothetical protein|nr:DUF2909 domain-containing protein [SAR86 cluster bacterium]
MCFNRAVLKTAILILLALILISLFSSLVFLFIDKGNPKKKRTLYGLGFRVTLGAITLLLIAYGMFTGQFGNNLS